MLIEGVAVQIRTSLLRSKIRIQEPRSIPQHKLGRRLHESWIDEQNGRRLADVPRLGAVRK